MRLPPRASRDLLAVIGTLALAAVLYPRAVFRGEAFFERDLHIDWYPRIAALARCLREGALPLWDPSYGFGRPLLADPSSQVSYPLSWPSLLIPLGSAYTVYVLVHLALAAVGTARLASALGAGRRGSLAAAGFFVLSGPLQSLLNLWHHFAGACWMPWVLLGIGGVARRPRLWRVLGLGLVAALQVLAGSADVCAMTWLIGAAWALARLPPAGRARRLRFSAALLAAAAVAVGLSAVLWLPALDLVSHSERSELPVQVREAWSVPVAGLLRLVVPLDPARVPFERATWQRLYDRDTDPLLLSLYLSSIVMVLGGAALAWRRVRRRAALLLALASCALLLAMGPHAPLYRLAALAPPVRVFRYPSKATLVVALALALAAGLGVRAIGRARLFGSWRNAAVAALLLAAGMIFWVERVLAKPDAWHVATLLAAAAAAVVAVLGRPGGMRAGVAGAALVGIAIADLVAAHADLNATTPPPYLLLRPTVLDHVDLSRRVYTYNYDWQPGVSESRLGPSHVYWSAVPPPGLDQRVFAMMRLRSYLPEPGGLDPVEGSFDLDNRGLYPRPLRDLTVALRGFEGTPAHAKLLRLAGVGSVVALDQRGFEDLRLVARIEAFFPEPILVFAVDGALPRTFVVGCARQGDGPGALADPAFDPSAQVLLPQRTEAGLCGPAGRSRIVERVSDRVQLEVEADRSAFVVLSDAWDPGWRATVDGRPAVLLRANVAFRAVATPPGRHTIEMVYRPAAVRRGALVSLSTLSLVLMLGLVTCLARARHRAG